MTTVHTVMETPIGPITLVADEGVLTGLYFPHSWRRPDPDAFGARVETGFEAARRQLTEYFDGRRNRFELPVDARGDDFQRRVWRLVAEIPHGRTTTYGALARRLGDAALARDVGAAVGSNPLCVIIPCHRVVGRDGALTGYAGGLKRKRFLLDLEDPADRLF